jgi:hypothetical protein
VVEIADGLSVHMTRRGIAAVLPPEEAEEDEEHAEDEQDGHVDEAAISESEEAVTDEARAEAAAPDRR